jgi:hypothetical protein
VSAIDDLKKLRKRLVESRRKAAAEGARPASDEVQAAKSIQSTQERIEAIDRAIEDERKLSLVPPPSIGGLQSAPGDTQLVEFGEADQIRS